MCTDLTTDSIWNRPNHVVTRLFVEFTCIRRFQTHFCIKIYTQICVHVSVLSFIFPLTVLVCTLYCVGLELTYGRGHSLVDCCIGLVIDDFIQLNKNVHGFVLYIGVNPLLFNESRVIGRFQSHLFTYLCMNTNGLGVFVVRRFTTTVH